MTLPIIPLEKNDRIDDVCAHIAAIAELNLKVNNPYLNKIFQVPPRILDNLNLVALYTFTGSANDDPSNSSDLDIESRVYRIQVAITSRGDAFPDVRETRGRKLISVVKDCFLGYRNLSKCPGVLRSSINGDSGIVVLPEWGAKFVGFELRLNVEQYVKVRHRD